MEPNLAKGYQDYPPPLNSLDSSKTLPESIPILSKETLGLFDYEDNSSPASEKALDNDNSDYYSLVEEADAEEGENEESALISLSPIRSSVFPHWSEPWSGMSDPKDNWNRGAAMEEKNSSVSNWTDLPSTTNLEIRPGVSALLTDYNKSCYFVGAGLENLGNTCFLNSVLQCFTHTIPLLQGIFSFNHRVQCDSYFEGFCVLCALREHIELSLGYMGRVISPWKFANNLNYFSSGFGRYQQEDAHEFLQCFLDKLESCCNDLILNDTMSSGNNFVKEVFGGRLVSKLRCCNCGHCSDTYEPSIDLSLEIDDADSLPAALESFTKIEKIEDPETKFTCEKCKEQVAIEKQLMLDQTPSVAAFHLKRFKNDGSFVEKIDKPVAFPLELDLQPYTAGLQDKDSELKYNLYAIVVHIGVSSCSGHYYCFIRSADNVWFKFDDSKVACVPEDYVLSQEAYILFYAKQGIPWFSSFIETQKCLDMRILNTSPKSVLDTNMDASTSSSSVPLHHSGDVNETSDATEEGFAETSSRQIGGKTDDSEDKENKVLAAVPSVAGSCANIPSCEAASDSVVRDESSKESVEANNVGHVYPKTPSRSPSPEIYREDPPESTYSIPRGHLRTVEHASCKRQLNKDLDNFEMKQARTFIKKSMPGSRGQQLMQAMIGSRSEGSLGKKRSRTRHLSPSTEDRSSNARRSRGSIPLVAASLR